MDVRVVGYGSLYRWLSSGERGESVTIKPGASIRELTESLGIPADEIWMVTVNGQKASLEKILQHHDEVRLFSPLGGGS